MTKAPDFRPGYPSRGELIGPAWQELWDFLADGAWYPATRLMLVPTYVMPKTAKNLLWRADKAGVIEKQFIIVKGRKRLVYRRPPTGK